MKRRVCNFPLRLPWGSCGSWIAALYEMARTNRLEMEIMDKVSDWSVFATHYQIKLTGLEVGIGRFKESLTAAITDANARLAPVEGKGE